jgi:hypothetical protein
VFFFTWVWWIWALTLRSLPILVRECFEALHRRCASPSSPTTTTAEGPRSWVVTRVPTSSGWWRPGRRCWTSSSDPMQRRSDPCMVMRRSSSSGFRSASLPPRSLDSGIGRVPHPSGHVLVLMRRLSMDGSLVVRLGPFVRACTVPSGMRTGRPLPPRIRH